MKTKTAQSEYDLLEKEELTEESSDNYSITELDDIDEVDDKNITNEEENILKILDLKKYFFII